MRYDIIGRLGEGNRGEVYKAKLEDGRIVAIKWAKNYDIDTEWEILNYLNGQFAPKPIFRGKRFFAMEYIEGKPLKELIGSDEYYKLMKEALRGAFYLDEKKVFHKQLGRYYHIYLTKNGVKFIDFERATFSNNPRNFLQLIGYYLIRDKKFDKKKLKEVIEIYKMDRIKALERIERIIDESCNKKV
ncbi:protein kinase domain-containing protein [Caminibacter sp.]